MSGYGNEWFTVNPWVGAGGMLFAFGRSLFIYAPIMLVAIPGLWLLRRPAGMRAWLVVTPLAILLLHGAWWSWWGGWSWGPRFLTPVLPLLSLGVLGFLGLRAAPGQGQAEGKTRRINRLKGAVVVALAATGFLVQLPGVLVYRTVFFGEVMRAFPKVDPDVASLYDTQFFMPLANVREILRGNLDLAWKAGQAAPLDVAGGLLAISGLALGCSGLLLAWRGGRAGRAAAVMSAVLVLGLALGSLIYHHRNDANPYRSLSAAIDERVPPSGVVLVGDHTSHTYRLLWNVNRSARRMVGVPSDVKQMQSYILPFVRQLVEANTPLWYLQTEKQPDQALLAELHRLKLCQTPYPLGGAGETGPLVAVRASP